MASLASVLPAPTRQTVTRAEAVAPKGKPSRGNCPPYGKRHGWTPRSQADFGDGGAFPEIHVAQYPLGMGKKKQAAGALALQVDGEGNVRYDAIARQGKGKDVVVHSRFTDLLPKDVLEDDPTLKRPDEDEIAETTEATKAALERIVSSKIAAAKPVKSAEQQGPAQYIRYTPAQQGMEHAGGSKQRIIRMVEMPVDPMDPPKFTHKKVAAGPPSPPAPVMHSPPRKVTPQEQADWVIPPCISNWKNPKGYTIPLDKRLAADGRGLQESQINHSFADFAAALIHAERKAREGVELRAQIQKRAAQLEKEKHEQKLRALAQKARDERAGIRQAESEESGSESGDSSEEERERLRKDRHYERERAKKISKSKDKKKAGPGDEDRDISEKIALGVPIKPNMAGENMYDQRLFNQSRGLGAGFGGEDSYGVYDQPLFNRNTSSSIYRPKEGGDMYADEELEKLKKSRFTVDKGFEGADRAGPRDGPVQFEQEKDEDIFGLDKFFTETKKGKAAMDQVGKGSSMTAGSASNIGDQRDGGSKRKMEFESSGSRDKRSRH
eukprot:comp23858_c0_seq1/m.41742 comp23858_c0_seq1/g.41742  ORF comp23858_c0_seq1/g.41742 comp23858_c0_seq1/m.41742 type:complete len:553 (-) comp23858_c0_seq1:252-1910(-)